MNLVGSLSFSLFSPSKIKVADDLCVVEEVDIEHVTVTSDQPEDPEIASFVKRMDSMLSQKLGKVVGHTEVPWDVRAVSVRTKVG